MTIFNKPPFAIPENISQWISRGFLIPDLARAHRYLSVISYYRLSAYIMFCVLTIVLAQKFVSHSP